VKLHPRAERFDLGHPGVVAVFAAAAERRLPVIIHAGLGMPSLGRDALTLAERYPGAPLILAHLGVTDLAWIWRWLGDCPGLFFDTAWWNPADHLALFAHVPPGRILLGSDTPYGTPAAAAIVAIRCALHAGLTPPQIQAVTGGQLQRLLAGDDPANLGPAPRPPPRPPLLDRVFTLLVAPWPECSTASRPRVCCSLPAWAARPTSKPRGAGASADHRAAGPPPTVRADHAAGRPAGRRVPPDPHCRRPCGHQRADGVDAGLVGRVVWRERVGERRGRCCGAWCVWLVMAGAPPG
jgi:hypothetical protein